MAVMLVLAAAHLAFWGWALTLGLEAGTMDGVDALVLAGWLAGIGFWLALVARLSTSGWLTGPGLAAQPWAWVPLPPVMLTGLGLFFVPDLRGAWLEAFALLPVEALPALNGLRILACGSILKSWRGELPFRIGYGVGILDLAFGLWSIVIAVRGGFTDPTAEFLWHLTGAGILVLMIPMVYTVLRKSRLNAPGKADGRAILAFPLVLAPAGLATLFLILHALALYATSREVAMPAFTS